MKKNILIISLATIAIVTGTSCSPKSFQAQSSLSSTTDSSNNNQNSESNAPLSIDSVDLKGQVQDNSNTLGVNDTQAFDFDKVRGEFIIMLPMPRGLIFTPSGSFANYKDITFSPVFDATGRMKLAVRVPIKYVLKGAVLESPTRLPSGEALPQMPAGKDELPSLALQFPDHDNMQIHLYIGVNALGLFLTLPPEASLPIPFNITLPIKNKAKTLTSGYLTYVCAKGSYPSGFFVSTLIPSGVARVLEDYFHL